MARKKVSKELPNDIREENLRNWPKYNGNNATNLEQHRLDFEDMVSIIISLSM